MCELNRRISQNSQRFFNKMNMENNEPVNLKFNKYWESSVGGKNRYLPASFLMQILLCLIMFICMKFVGI